MASVIYLACKQTFPSSSKCLPNRFVDLVFFISPRPQMPSLRNSDTWDVVKAGSVDVCGLVRTSKDRRHFVLFERCDKTLLEYFLCTIEELCECTVKADNKNLDSRSVPSFFPRPLPRTTLLFTCSLILRPSTPLTSCLRPSSPRPHYFPSITRLSAPTRLAISHISSLTHLVPRNTCLSLSSRMYVKTYIPENPRPSTAAD